MLHNIFEGNVDKVDEIPKENFMEIIIAGILIGIATAAAAIKTAPVLKPAPVRVKKK